MDVQFTISSEQNVREAFAIWAREQGYEIIESKEKYPDLRVRTPEGEKERFEVEKLASDFFVHNHDPNDADRIVCWRDDLGDESPLPVIQLESHINAEDSLRSPRYVISESGSTKEGWINQLLIWERGDDIRVKIRYYELEDQYWEQKSSGTPYLTASQFTGIFAQIPKNVRKESFYNVSFDALQKYVEENIEPEAFSTSVEKSADIGRFYDSEGGMISFGVLKSKPGFAIRGFNANNTYQSQGAAQLHNNDFEELFDSIPTEIADALFVQLDVEKALELAKERRLPTARQRNPEIM
jgi:hypothetical protein